MSSYSFRFQNSTSSKYIVYGLLAAFTLVALCIVLNFINLILILFSLFSPLVAGFWLFAKNGKAADIITTDEQGFTSTYHGRIAYDEIASIPAYSFIGPPPPSMKMILKSGKKIIWYLSPTKSIFNSPEDAVIFTNFTADLASRLQQLHLAEKRASKNTLTTSSLETEQKPENYNHERPLVEQIKEVSKRNKRQWAIPISLVISVMLFIKTCGTDFIQENRNDEISDIFVGVSKQYEQNIIKSKEVLREHVKTLGPVFLYSNDHSATVRLLPDIPEDPLPTMLPPVLSQVGANEHLEHLIKYPDSAEFFTVILTENGGIRTMAKSIMNYGDSTTKMLYLRFYDPNRKINPDRFQQASEVDSSTFVAFDMTTAVSIIEDQTISENLENSFINLPMMLAQLKHSPTFKVYMSGAAKDEITAKIFDEYVQELNKKLHDLAIDTTLFQHSVHNQ